MSNKQLSEILDKDPAIRCVHPVLRYCQLHTSPVEKARHTAYRQGNGRQQKSDSHRLDGTKELRNMSRKDIYQLLDVLKEYQSLGIAEQIDYDKFYLYSIITHSTAIEGSTVTEIENQLLFDEGITAKGRTLQEQMMNLDLKAAYEKSRILATHHVPITIDLLTSLAAIVMKNTGSNYKTVLGDFSSANGDLRLLNVRAGTEGKSYLNFQKVPARLKEFCEWLNEERSKVERGNVIDAYALSFDAHFRLVTIHPWADGNGRMSRLLMNHLQFEYQLIPMKVMKEQKAEYIQSLVDAREQDDISIFRRVMFDLHIRNLQQEIGQFRESMEQDVIGDKQKNVTDVTDRQHAIINLVKEHINMTTTQMAERLGVTKRTILRDIEALKAKGLIIRVGSEKTGYWELKQQLS
jgi:Fic family protein